MALSGGLESDHTPPLVSTHGQLLSFLANSLEAEFEYEKSDSMSYPALVRFRCRDGVISFDELSTA